MEQQPEQLGLFTESLEDLEEKLKKRDTPVRFGFNTADFNRNHVNDKDLTHIMTGLLNLQESLKNNLGTFFATLNPDEILAYAYGIGRRAESGQVSGQENLYVQMDAINHAAYNPQKGIKQDILRHLQERARSTPRNYHAIAPGNLKERIQHLEIEHPEIANMALSACLEPRKAGPIDHSKIYDNTIVLTMPAAQLTRTEKRKYINSVIGRAWNLYKTKK